MLGSVLAGASSMVADVLSVVTGVLSMVTGVLSVVTPSCRNSVVFHGKARK